MTIDILLARQRSGTGALGSILDQHPQIRYLGEVFHTNEQSRPENYFNFLLRKVSEDPRRAMPEANDRNFSEYMEHLAQFSNGKEIVVIDVKYSSTHHFNGGWHTPFDLPHFIHLAKRVGAKFIHLKRDNFVKTFVSGRLAEMNKVWHARSDNEVKVRHLQVNKHALLNYLNSTRKVVNHFDGYVKSYPRMVEVIYEDLFADGTHLSPEYAQKISDLFGTNPEAFAAIETGFVKQTPDILRDVITNFDEIKSSLAGGPYAGMLDE